MSRARSLTVVREDRCPTLGNAPISIEPNGGLFLWQRVLARCKKKADAQHIFGLPVAITQGSIHCVLHGLADQRAGGILDRFGGKKFPLYRVAYFFSRRFFAVISVHCVTCGGCYFSQPILISLSSG